MFFPMMFCCPMTYLALRSAAEARHAMVGMDPAVHRMLMRLVYGL